MKEWILLVSEDEGLSSTRAELLKDWHLVTTTSKDASDAILAKQYDLLILCQTVRADTARDLIARAGMLNPRVQALAISRFERDRQLNCQQYEVQFENPGGLRHAVASLLGQYI